MEDLKSYLVEMKKELKSDIENGKKETIKSFKTTIIKINEQIDYQNIRISWLEREVRKRNLIFHGINEEPNENFLILEEVLINCINNTLKVNCKIEVVDFIRRIGMRKENKPRPIVVGFISWRIKNLIFRNKNKLQGTNVFITEDFPKQVLQIRRELHPKLIEARKEGKYAIIRYDKLIIRENNQPQVHINKKRPMENSPPVDHSPQICKTPIESHKTKKNKSTTIINEENKNPGTQKITSFITRSSGSVGSLEQLMAKKD